jgi:hypothetical protein
MRVNPNVATLKEIIAPVQISRCVTTTWLHSHISLRRQSQIIIHLLAAGDKSPIWQKNLLEAPPSFVQRRLSARHLPAWSQVCFCQWASVFRRRFNPDASLETQTPIQLSSDETHFARGRPNNSDCEQRTPAHINPPASLDLCRMNLPRDAVSQVCNRLS